MNELTMQVIILVVFIGAMYFLLIRPQKKKEKEVQAMRNNLRVGDEIITIGGIRGKVVKTKDDSFVLMVGADKVKFEMMRWAVSSVEKHGTASKSFIEEEETKKAMPKRLKKVEKAEEPVEEEK